MRSKKELEKMREQLKAENPLLTEDQIEDILAESENGTGDENSASGNSILETPNPLLAEREALAKEKEALEAEKEALEAEKQALIAAGSTPQASGKTADSGDGKAVTYICKTRCTFRGQYYREGDSLTTSETVPDFFQAVQEGA